MSDEEQKEWLELTLKKDEKIENKLALYHIPLYPSNRPFDADPSVHLRASWGKIFDKNHIKVAFENHDHTYKRSKPLYNNEVNVNGTVYVGDGAFGVKSRLASNSSERFYIEKYQNDSFFLIVDVLKGGVNISAVNIEGKVFDTVFVK
eukprot:TRINITY_DN2219_c0_g1_i1.p1 TRINITY_DN2219_c0_g1~~TRINITY_DN2219_c0_g1_i1.p1  ORF type:complete len:148 (-),score=35.39 TRINITY_DN2219_c0_g1_i1:20-463(-)